MAIQKFVTIDLETGKKILKTLEASYIKFSDSHFPEVDNLDGALKAEITRALDAEGVLTRELAAEVKRATDAEQAINTLIGQLGSQDVSVKAALDRIEGLISDLTLTFTNHAQDGDKHITAEERIKWNQAVSDVATKANQAEMTAELAKKVTEEKLIVDGKIKTEFLPSIAVNSVTTVTSVDKAMELEIENGDVVIINPNAQEVKTKDTVITGTFICVDAEKEVFEEKFRQLYSNTDSVSKGEVDNLIKIETDRATKAEELLQQKIDTEKNENSNGSLANKIKVNKEAIDAEVIARQEAVKAVDDKVAIINGGEAQSGSIAHAVKTEKDRAEEAERLLRDRISTVEPIVTKLDGGINVDGSAAKLADTALQSAKSYTDGKIQEVNTSADALKGRVTKLETTVGSSTTGLVKDVADLKTKVDVINGDDSTPGSINKALADAKSYTDQEIKTEKTDRETADNKLQARIESLEAREDLKVKLGFDGAEESDLLTIRANGDIVRAELKDSSVVGIVVDANGANSKTVVMGKVDGFRGLVPGKSYFLGANGKITDIVPTEVGQHIIKVGVAISETELFVNIQEAIEIRA